MGGEYLKGITYDNYIVPEFLRNLTGKSRRKRISYITEVLKQKGIIISHLDLDKLSGTIESLDFLHVKNKRQRKFLFAFHIYGSSHHLQDSLIYMNNFKYLVNPFMDIDFLEMLAESSYISYKRKCISERLLYPTYFQVKLTKILLPGISDIPYNKRGFYTADDLTGPLLNYTLKRFRGYFSKLPRPANFEYNDAFHDYCVEEFGKLNQHIKYIFDYKKLRDKLLNSSSLRSEKDWHLYTNPINLSLNSKG
jgi:hypothetical protein